MKCNYVTHELLDETPQKLNTVKENSSDMIKKNWLLYELAVDKEFPIETFELLLQKQLNKPFKYFDSVFNFIFI